MAKIEDQLFSDIYFTPENIAYVHDGEALYNQLIEISEVILPFAEPVWKTLDEQMSNGLPALI